MINETFDIPIECQGVKTGNISIKLERLNEIEKKVDRLGDLLCEIRELAQSLSETTITASIVQKAGEE